MGMQNNAVFFFLEMSFCLSLYLLFSLSLFLSIFLFLHFFFFSLFLYFLFLSLSFTFISLSVFLLFPLPHSCVRVCLHLYVYSRAYLVLCLHSRVGLLHLSACVCVHSRARPGLRVAAGNHDATQSPSSQPAANARPLEGRHRSGAGSDTHDNAASYGVSRHRGGFI